jgi:phage terminase large subunit
VSVSPEQWAPRAAPPPKKARFPEKLKFLFKPRRYKVAYGGRGSAKSWNFARALIIRMVQCIGQPKTEQVRILCAREFQNSLKDSVHQLLSDQISSLGFDAYFSITDKEIRTHWGSFVIFSGLHNNVAKIKSMEGIDICWVEEAERVSNRSWELLIPTLRKPGSEIWITFNPDSEDDPTYVRFVKNGAELGDEAIIKKLSWRDNPWFPEELRKEKDYLARVDAAAYEHVWEGECRTNSDKQIMRGKYVIEAFTPGADWHGPYQGADWGFANDPTTLVRLWIHGTRLYIQHEAYAIGCDIDKTPALFANSMPDAHKYRTRADCARPETISYMQRHGFPEVVATGKWDGCVEDGITFIRQFEQIVIHPQCKHAIEEARLYSYKVDKLTDEVKAEAEDKHNHIWDAVRYALEPMIKQAGSGLLTYLDNKKKELDAEQKRLAAIPTQVGSSTIHTQNQTGISQPAIFSLLKPKGTK